MSPLDQELPNEKEMGFLDHLEEVRKRLFFSAMAIIAGSTFLFIQKDWLFNTVLFGPRNENFFSFRAWCKLSELIGAGDKLCVQDISYELINTTMMGNFTAHMIVSLIGGAILAFPFLTIQLWAFVKPALKAPEKKAARGAAAASSALFFMGVAFGYWGIVPLSLQFLGHYELGDAIAGTDVAHRIGVMSYVKTVATISFSSGLIFQLPVLIFFLARAGIVTPKGLKKYRRHALVGILVLSAIITPPDVTSQIMVSMPVLALYELGIVIARREEKRRKKKHHQI
ncbi:MAG: twin-arginine translocase subunit TatC [Bacteroidetes bacterium]|jgi:sec-independent protein translocase protein TatC|nr:twin-arginine translocase subunit TatC [Bacteroidota bacterium]